MSFIRSFAKTMDKMTGLDTGEYDHRHASKSQGQGCTGAGCICTKGGTNEKPAK